MKKLYILLVITVFLLGFILRFYELNVLPNGLNQDETALGYNAFLILHTGKDEYSHPLPLYFKSFGDYKLPVYIYLTVLSEKIFGVNAFAVRFWSAFLGSVTIIVFYFLLQFLSKDKWLSLLGAVLLTVNPWHLFFSRAAFEVNVANFFLVNGVFLFLEGVERKRMLLIFLSTFSFGLSLYSYNVTRLVAPLLLCFLVYLSWNKVKKIALGWKLFFLLFICIILTPFIVTLFSGSGLSMQKNVLIIGGESQANILIFRSYIATLPGIFIKLFFNNIVLWIWAYIYNMISFFSFTFFFISGGTFSVSVRNVGMFYPFEVISIIIGAYTAFKKPTSYLSIFTGWFIIVLFIISLSTNAPHATRDFTLIIPLLVFSAIGLQIIYRWIIKQSIFKKRLLIPLCVVFIAYSYLYFFVSYINEFPILGSKTWRAEDKPLSLFLQEKSNLYNNIVIDTKSDFIYTSLVFYQQYNPQDFLLTGQHEPDSLFIRMEKIGKYSFQSINWDKVVRMRKTLFVTDGVTQVPNTLRLLTTLTYPTRHIVLPIDTMYAQYPVTDIAYKVYASQ